MSYDAPPPPPTGGSPYGAPPPARAGGGKAMWSLICGVLGLLVCGLVFGLLAIVLGRRAQAEGHRGGTAKAGEVLGYVDIVLSLVFIFVWFNR